MINILLIVIVILVATALLFNFIKKRRNEEKEDVLEVDDKTYTLDMMIEFVKKRLDEITKINLYDIGLSEEELKRRKNKKYELKKALKGCTYGDVNDKKYVKELIYDLLYREYGVNETNVSKAIPFDIPSLLTPQDKFEIILYMYKNEFGYEALSEIIKKYHLDELKYVEGESKPCYVITADEISNIFEKENFVLTLQDKINVIVQRIYQKYKGYSSIDEIRDMNIDGISGGVSGLPESFLSQVAQTDGDYLSQIAEHKVPRACDSIWIMYAGKSIRLAFLSFGSEAELKRVCQNIYKYNNPGQLSDTNGYKINEMKDGSRVVVVRPSFSETWAFFVRKFAPPTLISPEQLLVHENKDNVVELLKYLIRGARVTAITGEQGCGKTTLLMAIMKFLYPTITIRVQETAFELHLRKIYPHHNILSLRETDTITGQEGLDVQKKTDGGVNILGEVATDPVAAWMIQMAQVASKFTLFTHHAKTFPNLITSLRNSLLKIGMFNSEQVAEVQVVQVINFDIHLKRAVDGTRYIERITECIPLEQTYSYNNDYRKVKDINQKLDKFMDNAVEYFQHMTQSQNYTYRNIVEFIDGKYVFKNPISEENIRAMRDNMSAEDVKAFDNFLDIAWR